MCGVLEIPFNLYVCLSLSILVGLKCTPSCLIYLSEKRKVKNPYNPKRK